MRDLFDAYASLSRGKQPSFHPLDLQYADYAAWQRSEAAIAVRKPQTEYWLTRLRDLKPLNLPTDYSAPKISSFRGHKVSADLPLRLRLAMNRRSGEWGVTPFILSLATFKLLLSRVCGTDDVAVGSPIANRHHLATESLVGTLVNTLVMRTDLSGDPSFQGLVERVKATALGAYANQDTPYDELVESLASERATHPGGLVRVLFNLRNAPLGQLALVDFDFEEFDFERVAAQFDLSIHIDTEFTQRIDLEYSTDLYTQATAKRWLDSYLFLLEQGLAEPSRKCSTFSLVPPREMDLLRTWNARNKDLPDAPGVHAYLVDAICKAPSTASIFDGSGAKVGHADVVVKAQAIAHALRAHGVAQGQRVGLSLPRGIDMLAAILGVWQAGGCYVPLDPSFPSERLEYMATDANLSLILQGKDDQKWRIAGGAIRCVSLSELLSARGARLETRLEPDPVGESGSDNPAYMIYTSGSTGRPKGVLVPHRAVMNLLASMADEPGLRAGEKLVAVTTLSFDISVLELLLPLATGADLVIVDSETARDAFALRSILESSLATALQATPSTWQMLLEAGWHPPVGFRALIGGEALHPSLAHRLIASGAEVWNLYGPTETTVWSTCWKVENPQAGISIGRPIANTSIWVLDSHGLPCPIGVPGEICIGGTGVALGYWQRPELTAERFIPNRFADLAGARMYKTGDLGRWRYDGLLEHLGRLDNQVKVRGFRIELGEIESALLEQSDLKQAVVVTQVGNGADVSLVAYVVPARPVVDLGAMRERLRALLPFYMIPNVIVRLDHLPRLPNGKIDRNRLPAPTESDIREALPPTLKRPSLTEDEQAMAAIWTEFLGADGIGSADNFFDLGGNSLLATRVAVAIKRRMGRHIHPRRFIFENLGQLARREKEIA